MPRTITDSEGATNLAKVIASDLSLYNEAAIEQGLRSGQPLANLDDQLLEARQLFLHRVAARLDPIPTLIARVTEVLVEWARARGLPTEGLAPALHQGLSRSSGAAALVVVAGDRDLVGSTVHLRDGVQLVGRTPEADLRLDAESVAPEHARLFVDGDVVEVENVRGSSGTLVDGESVRRTTVEVGSKIQVGEVILQLVRVAR
ncbi:FHA domain-containing protein [Paraliomyxa miuraensis]|uniref:FHA domain-containing protein n=1 Tax=Paraliomyxa miuraensis TaxID=376150 RepID=UPI0022590D28|nr:FHA domain-containing protein [Paraliomyxa miuraensis]MCX4245727.1 FHA domain-containing protein [Paraliomyxa miuraensis]